METKSYYNTLANETYRAYINDLGLIPFTFIYNDKTYKGFPKDKFQQLDHINNIVGEKETDIFTLKVDENLNITIQLSYYKNYGAYEYTVWFENVGLDNTGVIHSIGSEIVFDGENPVLRGILGDHENNYEPYAYDLNKQNVNFTSKNGRPTHIYFPYFNLEHGNRGTLLAIGWGGTWTADFSCDGNNTTFKGNGTNDLCTYLKPNESIRSALMLFIPYNVRDEDYVTNLWRRWYIDCNMPKLNAKGENIQPFSTTCLCNDTGLPNSDGSISERSFTWKPSLEKMFKENIRPNYRWFDAGWYFDPYGNTVETEWWHTIGTWELDTIKWPNNSFRESTDYAHDHEMKTLVWFEPERVTHVDGLVENYGYKQEWSISDGNDVILNNIGDPECLQWTLNRIINFMGKYGVDMYREDNNSNPVPSWKIKDDQEGKNRSGITENKAVVGHYMLWDGIIDFCGINGKDTFVDSCASGGGRNDLESMRRGVPILRSDADRTTTSLRLSMTSSFNKWIPFCGAATTEQSHQLAIDGLRDKYIFRASYNATFNISAQWIQDPNTDFDLLRFGINEWNSVKDYILKDFYVFTPWHSEDERSDWTSYMYFDPIKESGIVLAFRMEEAKVDSYSINLTMLNKDEMYELKDADTGIIDRFSGSQLSKGYTIQHANPRSAALIYINKCD